MSGQGGSLRARAAVHGAVVSTLARLSPGHGAPRGHHLDLLARLPPPPLPSVWTDADASALAVLLFARSRRDALSDELSLIDRYFANGRLTRPAHLSPAVRVQLMAAAGDYCNALGWPQRAASFGAEALLFADSDRLRYRALAVQGLAHALNGEYVVAEAHLSEAADVFARNGWPVEDTDYLTLLAETLVASARMSPARLAAVAATLAAAHPADPYWAYTSRAATVMRGLFERDYAAALAESIRLSTGPERHHSHRMVRDFVTSIRADVLVAQGDYVGALVSLEHAETRPGHGICFHMQRSAALLLLRRERELLAETESCVVDEPDHCLRTLVPTLLRRAIAFARVGEQHRAEQSASTALLLVARTGESVTPFLMLPRQELSALFEAVASSRADLAGVISRIVAVLPAITSSM